MKPKKQPLGQTPDKCPLKVDQDEIDMWMGLAVISAYFGFSIEKATNRILDPAIKKVFKDISAHIKNQ